MTPSAPASASRTNPRGFTLVEVAVASAIILVLVGVALVSYAALNSNRSSTQAELTLNQTYAAQRTYFTYNRSYTTAGLSRMPEGVVLVTTPSVSARQVSAAVSPEGTEVGLALMAPNDDCFYLAANSAGETATGTLTGTCSGESALAHAP